MKNESPVRAEMPVNKPRFRQRVKIKLQLQRPDPWRVKAKAFLLKHRDFLTVASAMAFALLLLWAVLAIIR